MKGLPVSCTSLFEQKSGVTLGARRLSQGVRTKKGGFFQRKTRAGLNKVDHNGSNRKVNMGKTLEHTQGMTSMIALGSSGLGCTFIQD